MSNANAFSTFGTKPSFSLLRSKKAAIAGVSLAGFSFSALISVSSAIAVPVIAVRGALPRLVGSARRFGADLVRLRIWLLLFGSLEVKRSIAKPIGGGCRREA